MFNHKIAIADIINSYSTVSSDSITELSHYMEFMTIPKDTIFIKTDSYNTYDYFLLKGISRSFIFNLKAEDVTISFFQDKTILTPNVARTFKGRSTLNFEALTDIEIARFEAMELVKLMRERSEMRNFANAVLQKELILKSNKELDNASLTAKQRLLKFREQFDSLENLIPHPMIASYLGITKISLSRIRRDLANH